MDSRWPNPDPIVQDMETYAIAEDQPIIFELTSLGVEAQRRGKGIDFAKHASHLIFGGTERWNEGEHLAKATAAAGLDLAEMKASLEGGDHLKEIEANQDALEASGHWGVPTYVLDGEPYFGQDRIATVRWQLEKQGLKR